MNTAPPTLRAAQYPSLLQDKSAMQALAPVYGANGALISERCALLTRAVEAFGLRFGDAPVRIFRAPGRINLRGMHVDTHGGFLNLMTHQREIVVVAAPRAYEVSQFHNLHAGFASSEIDPRALAQSDAFRGDWMSFIQHPDARRAAQALRGDWRAYLLGCTLRLAYEFPGLPLRGIDVVVTSDLPQGACLSSSAALCVAVLLALLDANGLTLDQERLILAARGAEWFTGARTGAGDQTAVVAGRQGQILHVAVLTEDFSLENAQHIPFPGELDLLVINSFTQRSLSGAQLLSYTQNRFAYSIALEVLRQELHKAGYEDSMLRTLDRLSRLDIPRLGGDAALLRVLKNIPEFISLAVLQQRYTLPDFDVQYERYFGDVPAGIRPATIALRGPLLFGLAESERARQFPQLLAAGQFEAAGSLMNTGHNGDRICNANGLPHEAMPLDDDALERLARDHTRLQHCPGVYGASSPALDALVDAALAGGALGACLTGAGIAGAVLALCRKEQTAAVSGRILRVLESSGYRELAGLPGPINAAGLEESVVINHAPAGASALSLP